MIASRLRTWSAWAALVTGSAVAQTPAPLDGLQNGGVGSELAAMGVITTHAEARRRLPNTVSDVSVSIEVHARDLPGASALLARRSQTLLGYLRGQGAERLITEQVSMEPELQEVRGQPDRIKGFTGRSAVSFRTTPDRLPVLLAGCLDNGATGLLQSGSSPREDEIETARRELADEAVRAALAQAVSVAKAADQRVAGIQHIDVDPFRGVRGLSMEADAVLRRAPRPSQPIAAEAGESGISVTVLLRTRIAPRS